IADTPQIDLLCANSDTNGFDVLRAFIRIVCRQVNPLLGQLARAGAEFLSKGTHDVAWIAGLIQREIPGFGAVQVRFRNSGPALIEQDDVANFTKSNEDRKRRSSRGVNSGTSRPSGKVNDRRPRFIGHALYPDECKFDLAAGRLAPSFGNAEATQL